MTRSEVRLTFWINVWKRWNLCMSPLKRELLRWMQEINNFLRNFLEWRRIWMENCKVSMRMPTLWSQGSTIWTRTPRTTLKQLSTSKSLFTSKQSKWRKLMLKDSRLKLKTRKIWKIPCQPMPKPSLTSKQSLGMPSQRLRSLWKKSKPKIIHPLLTDWQLFKMQPLVTKAGLSHLKRLVQNPSKTWFLRLTTSSRDTMSQPVKSLGKLKTISRRMLKTLPAIPTFWESILKTSILSSQLMPLSPTSSMPWKLNLKISWNTYRLKDRGLTTWNQVWTVWMKLSKRHYQISRETRTG